MSRLDEIKEAWQEMLKDCDGEESQGFYGWIGKEDVKWLIEHCSKLEKVRKAAEMLSKGLERNFTYTDGSEQFWQALKEAEYE